MSKWVSGTIVQILLLFIILPVISCIVGFIPGGPEFLSDLFWSTLGVFDIFEGAADVMKSFAAPDRTSNIVKSVWTIISESFLQSIILGACVMTINDVFSAVRAPFGNYKIFPLLFGLPVLTSAAGFAIGLLLISAIGIVDHASVQALLYALVSIGVLLLGIGIMLGLNRRSALYSKGRVVGLLGKMFMGALFSAALSGAIAALMQAPIAIANGARFWAALGWYIAMCIAMIVICVLFEVFYPDRSK